jgi:hypothetical protein
LWFDRSKNRLFFRTNSRMTRTLECLKKTNGVINFKFDNTRNKSFRQKLRVDNALGVIKAFTNSSLLFFKTIIFDIKLYFISLNTSSYFRYRSCSQNFIIQRNSNFESDFFLLNIQSCYQSIKLREKWTHSKSDQWNDITNYSKKWKNEQFFQNISRLILEYVMFSYEAIIIFLKVVQKLQIMPMDLCWITISCIFTMNPMFLFEVRIALTTTDRYIRLNLFRVSLLFLSNLTLGLSYSLSSHVRSVMHLRNALYSTNRSQQKPQ